MFLKFAIPLCVAVLATAQASMAQQPPGQLKINVIAGQGAVNNIIMGVAAQPIVEVLDAQGNPVPNAEVTFEAPAAGPSGTFFGGLRHTERTDDKGRVQARGFAPNNQLGKFEIAVRVKTANAAGQATVTQTNGGPGTEQGSVKSSSKKFWVIAGLVAAGAIGGGVALSNRGNGVTAAEAAKRPVTIGAGPITVGGPR